MAPCRPVGQQNSSKPTALRMIEDGAERIVAVHTQIDRSGYPRAMIEWACALKISPSLSHQKC